jgi:phage gpG-like protein
MISVTVDDSAVRARFSAMPEKIQSRLTRAVTTLAEKLRTHVVKDKLLGQVLNRRSGRLGQSIQEKVESTASSVIGTVYSAGDVKYARINEYGGVINHPGGTPFIVTRDYGAMFISKIAAEKHGGNWPVTKPHQIVMPERSYMRSSLADMKTEIIDQMTAAVGQGTKA